MPFRDYLPLLHLFLPPPLYINHHLIRQEILSNMSEGFDLGKACLEGNSRLVIRHLEGLREEDASLAQKAVLQPDVDRRTPLHWAASSGLSSEAIRLICDCGGKEILESRDSSGWTALMIASSAGRAETVEQLLYAGADAIAANPRGQTSLHYAASKGHLDVAKVLLEQGPGGSDVNCRDGAKQCPLHRAATTGNDAIIRLLLSPPAPKNGAKREKTRVNPQDRLGNTPLHLAFDSGNGSSAIILIEEGGADRNRLNQDDQKPEEMPGTNEIEQRKVLQYVRSHVG